MLEIVLSPGIQSVMVDIICGLKIFLMKETELNMYIVNCEKFMKENKGLL